MDTIKKLMTLMLTMTLFSHVVACKKNGRAIMPPFLSTPTITFTPSNTPSITLTPTITLSPTPTYTFRICSTPPTWTPTETITPTGKSLSLSVTYTGPLAITTVNPIFICISNTTGTQLPTYRYYGRQTINSSSGTVSFCCIGEFDHDNVFSILATIDPSGNGNYENSVLKVGGYYQYFENTCNAYTPAYQFVTVTGNDSVTLQLSAACRGYGLAGTYNYTGAGIVDSNRSIFIQASLTPDFSCIESQRTYYYETQTGRYDQFFFIDNSTVSGPYYVRIFYDHNMNAATWCPWSADCPGCAQPDPGDPCKQLPGTFYTSTDLQAALDVVLTDEDRCGN